ncbi:hypothetical protein Droror1_Dr00016678 [Drosera rotundifolia]
MRSLSQISSKPLFSRHHFSPKPPPHPPPSPHAPAAASHPDAGARVSFSRRSLSLSLSLLCSLGSVLNANTNNSPHLSCFNFRLRGSVLFLLVEMGEIDGGDFFVGLAFELSGDFSCNHIFVCVSNSSYLPKS